MAKKTVYLENALKGLVEELTEKINGKKQGDRLSIAAYYGKDQKLFRQSEIDASVGKVFQESGVGLEQLPCGAIGSKIVFQIVNKEAFEKLFNIKESKSVKLAEEDDETTPDSVSEPKAKTTGDSVSEPKAETTKAVSEPKTETTGDAVSEPKTTYTVSAFEQVKALIPSLTAEEKKELVKLLKA